MWSTARPDRIRPRLPAPPVLSPTRSRFQHRGGPLRGSRISGQGSRGSGPFRRRKENPGRGSLAEPKENQTQPRSPPGRCRRPGGDRPSRDWCPEPPLLCSDLPGRQQWYLGSHLRRLGRSPKTGCRSSLHRDRIESDGLVSEKGIWRTGPGGPPAPHNCMECMCSFPFSPSSWHRLGHPF